MPATLSRWLRSLRARARGALEIAVAEVVLARCPHGRRIHASGRIRVANAGHLRLGDRLTFRGGPVPTELVCRPGAVLEIGDGTFVNYGCSFEASSSIRIGRRCLFGKYVQVEDGGSAGAAPSPIVIGDDVWVAHGAIIQAGVSIGNGSIVSAGSVVTSDVPPLSIAIGNPARTMSLRLRSLEVRAPSTA